jgi:photosystem II stability/assembly factor-like uncharacterized protein
MAQKKAIVIATAEGPFLGVLDGGAGVTRRLGLEGKGPVRAVIHDHREPGRLYAASLAEGVWRSDDGGATWREINDGILYRHGFCIVQHPVTGELYYGSEPASVFKSTDYGESWHLCQGLQKLAERDEWTFPNPPHVAHVRGLGLCAADPLVIFGAVEEGWVVRSTDGGEAWENCKQGTHFDGHTVTVMPDNPNVVIETAGRGAYRSDDGGDSFTEANTGLEHSYLAHLAVHPERPHVLFTAGASVPPPGWRRPEGPGCGFYRSDNQGLSWSHRDAGLPGDIAMAAPRAVASDPADPDGFYFGLSNGTVWATNDGGESFFQAFGGLPDVFGLQVAPDASAMAV